MKKLIIKLFKKSLEELIRKTVADDIRSGGNLRRSILTINAIDPISFSELMRRKENAIG